MNQYVIIGNGIAGITAARTIRKQDSKSTISLIEKDHDGFIYRPALRQFLNNEIKEKELQGIPEKVYLKEDIKRIQGEALSIDKKEKSITYKEIKTKSLHQLPYTKLLIATGGNPRIPQELQKASTTSNCHTFRTLKDTKKMIHSIQNSENITIIGGGVLGVETAEIITQQGKKVTIIARSNNLLFHGIPENIVEKITQLLKEKNIEIILQGKITNVHMNNNQVTSLEINTKAIPCDDIIICTGISPNSHLAEKAGLTVNQGIQVDSSMRSSDSEIYAAGDCVSLSWFQRKTIGTWIANSCMGKVAGLHMTGTHIEYNPWPLYYHTFLFQRPIGFFGDYDAQGSESRREIMKGRKGIYKELVFQNDHLIGGSFFGGRPPPAPFFHLLRSNKIPQQGYKALLDDSYDYDSLWYI
jgi:nitrite reductase (NADH) large subunit